MAVVDTRPKKKSRILGLATAVVVLIALAVPAWAHSYVSMHPAFPDHGWAWYANNGSAPPYLVVRSDACDSAETAAIDRTTSQTKASTALDGTWPDGFRHYRYCSSTNGYDMKIDHKMNSSEWYAGHSSWYTGHVHSYKASSSWCAAYSFNYPCGNNGTIMHINNSKLNGMSETTQRNVIMHELTHVHGFRDVCNYNVSLSSNCDYDGVWKWNDLDALIDHIYPNYPYNP